jgi:hypothetical protein
MRWEVVAVIAIAVPAHAAPPGMTPTVARPLPALWTQHVDKPSPGYRAQTLVLDVLAVTALVVGFERNELGGTADPIFIDAGIGMYVLGSPIVHTLHGRPGRGLASLAMRVGFPVITAVVGFQVGPAHRCSTGTDNCINLVDGSLAGGTAGLLLGATVASAIDTIGLAKGDDQLQPTPTWSPTIGAARTTIVVGVAGSF